jgi:tetratricopeptide (TPR) repeat protein
VETPLFGQKITPAEFDQLLEDCGMNTFLTIEEDVAALKNADSLARIINYPDGMVLANLSLAGINRDFDPSISLNYISVCDSLYTIYPDVFSDEILVQLNLNKGYNLGAIGDLFLGLKHYVIADSISKRTDLQNLTNQYFYDYYVVKEDYPKALVFVKKSIAYYKDHGLPNIYLKSLLNAGSIYHKAGIADSAIFYVKGSICS